MNDEDIPGYSTWPLRYKLLALAMFAGVMWLLGAILRPIIGVTPTPVLLVVLIVMMGASVLAIVRDKRRQRDTLSDDV